MKPFAYLFLILSLSGTASAQSCFPVGQSWSGSFIAFSGWGSWKMTAQEDVWIKGTLCQAMAYRESSWNPMGPNEEGTIYYHHDGEYLYQVETGTGDKHVVYKNIHLPGDTVLIPPIWQGFGLMISGEVLDTFSVDLIDSSWFAYTIEWTCSWDATVSHDTITVIPGFGWWPNFSIGIPLGYIPECGLFDGMYYSLSCAWVPSLGLYGDEAGCEDLVPLQLPESSGQPLTLNPNPARDWIRVSGITGTKPVSYQILNALGQFVTEVLPYPDQGMIRVDNLPSGLYYLLVRKPDSSVQQTGRFIRSE